MPWPGAPSRRGGPLRVSEWPNGHYTTLDGVGWSTTLDDLARQQLAAGWLPGTRLEVTTKDAAGRDIGRREVSIRDAIKPPDPDVAIEEETAHHIPAPPDPPTSPLRVVRQVVMRG